MKKTGFFTLNAALLASTLGFSCAIHAEDYQPETIWLGSLKKTLFADKNIIESNDVIQLKAPYRAEDAALVPLQINSQFAQSSDHYIKQVTLVIDSNPVPWAGTFRFTPQSGKADVALRARINAYSWVRAIAELNDGSTYMTKVFVKASGGCSAPLGADMDAAMARMGKMKFKLDTDTIKLQQANEVQLLISHPNLSGMQMDQLTRVVQPAHFVNSIKVSFDGLPVFEANTDIAISTDPNFRFYFVPTKGGELKAEVTDNLDKHFSYTQTVTP